MAAPADAAFEHFASKPAFKRWAPGVLRDYIASGTEAHGSLQRLSFHRDVETSIYNTLPHHLARTLRAHPMQCATAFVRGTESTEVKQVGLSATHRLTHGRISAMTGSHLFPMEHPAETAAEVLRLIESLPETVPTPRL